ncbi:hypothetical protein PF008_g21822 [Phytophthora fragariae]|uniref:Uncharacterized protein n=1 Tax=Phytophthora fragariae TaxID=53985 RepID=A0A6G0QVH5_9STRA|nr:hypothetical protein PF008_g21822 [Phytophthora fragariae]
MAGLRALNVKDGGAKDRKEHVDHLIETLGDSELIDHYECRAQMIWKKFCEA